MRIGWRLVAIWACFAARLLFYAAMLPLWEGYDEWSHFAVIRTMATRGVWLVARNAPVPRDIGASLDLAPVAWEMRGWPPPALTEDAFWKLPAEARRQREAAFRAMPPEWRQERDPRPITAYEALQPPLYYWLMAPAMWLMSACSLPMQAMMLRWLSALLASIAIPLIYAVARTVLSDERVALGCAAIAALMPEWAFDVARVGNDCLSVALFTLLIWLALQLDQDGPRRRWVVGLGAVLGLGLLTKAWFLVAILALALFFLWRRNWRTLAGVGFSGAIAAGIGGWWYIRNLLTTGTLSGLSESVMLRHTGVAELVRAAFSIPWATAIDEIFFTHLYWGGWSSLSVRAWMYHLFYVMILAAAIGLWRLRRQPRIAWLAAVYFAFWVGQFYNVVLIWLSKGVPASMGWYFYAIVAVEVPLAVAGLRAILPQKAGNAPLAAGVSLFGLFDLYTMHAVAVPYYTGVIGHKVSGAPEALHWAELRAVGLQETVGRLTIFKGGVVTPPLLLALWLAYLLGTAWLMVAGTFGGGTGKGQDILQN